MYEIVATHTFSLDLKQFKRNRSILTALDKKVARLRTDPHTVGKPLRGVLHGYYSTRILQDFRLLFSIDEERRVVTLETLDHRKDVYD